LNHTIVRFTSDLSRYTIPILPSGRGKVAEMILILQKTQFLYWLKDWTEVSLMKGPIQI
jgi:hypothetical protein